MNSYPKIITPIWLLLLGMVGLWLGMAQPALAQYYCPGNCGSSLVFGNVSCGYNEDSDACEVVPSGSIITASCSWYPAENACRTDTRQHRYDTGCVKVGTWCDTVFDYLACCEGASGGGGEAVGPARVNVYQVVHLYDGMLYDQGATTRQTVYIRGEGDDTPEIFTPPATGPVYNANHPLEFRFGGKPGD